MYCKSVAILKNPSAIRWSSDGKIKAHRLATELDHDIDSNGGFRMTVSKPEPDKVNTKDAFDFFYGGNRFVSITSLKLYSDPGHYLKKITIEFAKRQSASNGDSDTQFRFVRNNVGNVKVFNVVDGLVKLDLPPTNWIRIYPQDWNSNNPRLNDFEFFGCEAKAKY